MKRILVAAVPLLAVAMIVAGPAGATTKKPTCQQIRAELASGKKPAEVAKELKISQKAVDHCNAKVASTKKHTTHGAAPASQSAPAQ